VGIYTYIDGESCVAFGSFSSSSSTHSFAISQPVLIPDTLSNKGWYMSSSTDWRDVKYNETFESELHCSGYRGHVEAPAYPGRSGARRQGPCNKLLALVLVLKGFFQHLDNYLPDLTNYVFVKPFHGTFR